MDMGTWAEREVEIACKRANPDRKEVEFDCSRVCYESALKAYKSLMDDNYSGFSFGVTKGILIRLMNDLPLTAIEDDDEYWELFNETENEKDYQCSRMPSLFKYVYSDKPTEFYDVNRVRVTYNNGVAWWNNGFISRFVHKMAPIEMPYYPSAEHYKVYCERPESDVDLLHIKYVITPDHERVDVNKYFILCEPVCKEIDEVRYKTMKARANKGDGNGTEKPYFDIYGAD